MDSYLQWSQEALGISFNQPIHVNNCLELERGLCCTQNIKADSIVLTIPHDCLFSIKCITSSSQFYSLTSVCREDDLLALNLLHEKYAVGKQSKWANHISILPESYDNIINYSTNELSYLEGSNLHRLAIVWQNQVKQDFTSLYRILSEEGFNVSSFSWLTYDNYLWALSTIWTRFVTLDYGEQQLKTMIPVFDLLNHSPTSRVGHFNDLQRRCLYLYSAQEWKAGEEIFLNYGHLSNYRLLMLYGFTVFGGSNPYDAVDVWLNMSETAPYYQLKKETLEGLHINDNEPFQITLDHIPANLLTCLRVHLATESDVCKLSAAAQPLSVDNEREVIVALESALEGMLAAYPSSVEEDECLLALWGLMPPKAGECRGAIPDGDADAVGAADSALLGSNYYECKLKRVKDSVVLRHSEKLIINSVLRKLKLMTRS